VLYNIARDRAALIAERIQLTFEKAAADIDGRLIGATVSTGVAFSSQGPFELPAMLLQADQALYRAKQDGRNRMAVAPLVAVTPGNDKPPLRKVAPLSRRSAA
jgi:diguanylate cyclase (GGDEF)-like protein